MRPVQHSPAGDEPAVGGADSGRGRIWRPEVHPGEARGGRACGAGSRRGVSIHVVVIALVVALVAPATGFLAYIVYTQNREQQRAVAARGAQIAGEIADRVESEFTTLRTILSVFATSGWLEDDELERLHRRARAALAGTDRHLIVLDPDFQQVLNTRVPFGTPLGITSDVPTAAEVLRTGEPAISNVFQGRVAGTAVFNVLRPVALPDGSRRVLILTRDAGSLVELFGSALRDSVWSIAVFDGAGRVVSAVVDPREPDATIPAACREGGAGSPAAENGDQVRHVLREKIQGTVWSACAWVAAERLEGRLERSRYTLLTGIVAWLGAALVAAVLLSASISRAIANTARVGEALKAGHEVPIPPSFVSEIDEVRRYLAGAAAESIRKDQRLELLLRETAHRAKNQLTLAVSLIGLSARNADSVEELKENLTGRLLALGRSIDAVRDGELDAAPVAELIRAQLEPFVDDAGDRLAMRGGLVPIPEKTAQSLSLVLHELATNAAKYGAWSQPAGKVVIVWRAADGTLTLDWSETGAPAPEPERQGFGTKLVDTLVEAGLGGTIDRRFGPSGFGCRITVPLDRVEPSA